MNALVCAIPTMRISTVVLGKAVRNAGISGRHVITKLMRKIQSIGQNIERWERDEVQIPGTNIALSRAMLDALSHNQHQANISPSCPEPDSISKAHSIKRTHNRLIVGFE